MGSLGCTLFFQRKILGIPFRRLVPCRSITQRARESASARSKLTHDHLSLSLSLSLRLSISTTTTGMTSAGTCDPYAVVTQIATEPGKTPHVLGKTEVVENTVSPSWVNKIAIDYELGTPCRLAVSVFHKKKKSGESESMGAAIFDVAQTLGARGSTKAKKVKGGTLFATIRETEGSGTLCFQFRGDGVSYSWCFFECDDARRFFLFHSSHMCRLLCYVS